MEKQQAKRIIEALLFTSEKPLTITQFKEVLEECDNSIIKALIGELKSEYAEHNRSFNIVEIAGGYLITTDAQYAPWLKKLYRKSRTETISHPALETLAIIAYRQPISRQEVEGIRGVNVEGVLRTLMERSLVRISGRKSVPGRPFLYSTTRQFLEFFGLHSLEDLPQLREFEAVDLDFQKNGLDLVKETKDQVSSTSGGNENGEIKKTAQENRPD